MIVPVDSVPSIARRPPYQSTAIRPSCGIRLKTGTNFARRSDRPHRRLVDAVGVDGELVDLLLLLTEALHDADADDASPRRPTRGRRAAAACPRRSGRTCRRSCTCTRRGSATSRGRSLRAARSRTNMIPKITTTWIDQRQRPRDAHEVLTDRLDVGRRTRHDLSGRDALVVADVQRLDVVVHLPRAGRLRRRSTAHRRSDAGRRA